MPAESRPCARENGPDARGTARALRVVTAHRHADVKVRLEPLAGADQRTGDRLGRKTVGADEPASALGVTRVRGRAREGQPREVACCGVADGAKGGELLVNA